MELPHPADRLALEVGIPDGVINVVPGYGPVTGAALAAHPGLKRLSFTGSPEVGRSIAEACGRNLVPVKLELGGKGAALVFDDVPLEQTVEKPVRAITFHTGQICCDATRWIVHRPIYDRFVSACAERLRQVKIGYQMAATTEMGPVVNEKQRRRVLDYLQRGRDEGAEVVLEGGAAEVPGRDGFYVKPALLAGSLDNVAAREEIFGPVAYLAAFEDEEEAVRMANRDGINTTMMLVGLRQGSDYITGRNLGPRLCRLGVSLHIRFSAGPSIAAVEATSHCFCRLGSRHGLGHHE